MFAIPNDRWFERRHWNNFPYTLGILAAVLKDKYEVEILDASLEDLGEEEIKKRIEKSRPDVVGISCLSMEYTLHFQKMAELVKSVSKEIKVVVGGIYPTLLPTAILGNHNIDFVVIGEGEYRFPKLLKYLEDPVSNAIREIDGLAYRLNGDVIVQPLETYITNLDNIPLPYYEIFDIEKYMNQASPYSYYTRPNRFPVAFTITSRGCPFNCVFCSSKAINGLSIRYRSAENVLKEIDLLVQKYGIKEIIFYDDNFFLNRERLIKILNGLVERNYDLEWKTVNAAVYALDEELVELMKKSGCYQIALAIESGTKEGLELMRKPFPEKILSNAPRIAKKARSLGMDITGLFIIGIPGETWEMIRETLKFADGLDLDYCSFNIATPLPATDLYKTAKEKNLLPEDFDFNALDFKGFGRATITTNEFTPEELQILRAFEWDRINFKTPEKIARIAKMHGLTIEEIQNWRKSTRRGLGVKVRYK